MRKYILKQLRSFKFEWDTYPKQRLKLLWMAFLIWFLFAPIFYILLFTMGAITLQNPHRFAANTFNELG